MFNFCELFLLHIFDLIMFKYLFCFMIKFRTLNEIDSIWDSSIFLKCMNKMKIADHSWFFNSRRSWIFLVCSIFFLIVKRRSYSSESSFMSRFLLDVISRSNSISICCAFCASDEIVVSETCSVSKIVVDFELLMRSSMILSTSI
jgi:hypothetical protein